MTGKWWATKTEITSCASNDPKAFGLTKKKEGRYLRTKLRTTWLVWTNEKPEPGQVVTVQGKSGEKQVVIKDTRPATGKEHNSLLELYRWTEPKDGWLSTFDEKEAVSLAQHVENWKRTRTFYRKQPLSPERIPCGHLPKDGDTRS